MSIFLNKADLLASRLNRVVGLESYKFMVDRPRTLSSELEKLNEKPTGAGVIKWMGGPAEKDASPARVNSSYRIALLEVPTMRRNHPSQDEIAQLVIQAVHDWDIDDKPDGSRGPNAPRTKFKFQKVQDVQLENTTGVTLYIFFDSITQLPKPDITLRP